MSLEQIGQKLKSARDGSGLSLSQIQEKTKIPFSHLSAIDAGSFEDLPEPVYVSGFIKRYAECVGLNGQQLVDEYRNEIEGPAPKSQKHGFRGNRSNGNNNAPTTYSVRPSIESSAPNLLKVIPFYAFWIVLVLGLVIYVINRQGTIDLSPQDSALLTLKQSTGASGGVQDTTPAVDQSKTTASQPTDSNSTSQQNLADKEPSGITLKAKNHVWVEVKAVSSGEALFNGFMESGDSHDFSDKEGFRVRAGNGGSVLITSAGKTAPLGLPGKITEKTYASGKVNQVAENQTDTTSEPIPDAKPKPSESVTSAKKPSSESTIVTTKKPAETTVTKTKKPTIASTPKPRPVHESVPTRDSNDNSETNSNSKSIDVPYRY